MRKGLIQVTNTSIKLKAEDGSEIRLVVLKEPISIDNLVYEHEASDDGDTEENDVAKALSKSSLTTEENNEYSSDDKPPLTFLKEPFSLDEIGDGKELSLLTDKPCDITNIETRASRRSTRQEIQIWKRNALILFEFAYIYPFVHAANKFKCYICSKPFVDPNFLREHSLNDHTIVELESEINKKTRDKVLKVDVVRLQCKLCHMTFQTLDRLKRHLRDHGKQIDPDYHDNVIPFRLGGDTFDCQICGENFQRLRLLIIHMSKHFNNYSCEVCGSVFVSMNLLKRHLQTHKIGSYPCEKCDKIFTNSAKRISHMRGVHLKQCTRTCPLCPERFNSNYQRSKHLRVYHNQTNRYRCEICGRQYDLKYQLLLHKRSVHLHERNQECSICHSRFFSKYCLSRHMVIHTGEKNFKCEVCGKAYARRKSLREHTKSHGVLHSTCSVCSRTFNDHASLVTHMSTFHWVSGKLRSGPRTSIWQMTISERHNAATFIECTTVKPFFYQQANFKCFYCNEVFPEVRSVLQHTGHHEAPERNSLLKLYLRKGKRVIKVDISDLRCKLCNQQHLDLDDMRRHLVVTHKIEFNSAGNGLMAYDLNANNGLLTCHKCEKSFNSFFLLNRHMNVHFSVVCETCGLGFLSHQRLVNHRVVHQNGVHKCDRCQDVFPTKLKLRYHVFKKHEAADSKKSRPLKCPHCLERFAEHYRKMTHLREVHGIAFTFDCHVCGAAFTQRRALTEHTTKQHTRRIQCSVCGKCFGTKSLLKMHARGHTGERNFSCAICQKAYMHERTLRQHMRAHGPVWRFNCPECGTGFHSRCDFDKHMRHWHPNWQLPIAESISK